jgi:molybdopterin-guanine dinucleotide biosynthesis protein A
MIDPTALVVAVLAGGEGSRIGGGKPLIRLGGRTLIERAYERARGWSGTSIVAVRSPAQLGEFQFPWIADAAGIDGPLAGLAAALEWACRQGAEALLTVPCDMPFLPEDIAKRLLDNVGDLGAAVASSGGELHPVCSLWRNSAIYDFPGYCASGRRSLKGFAEHVGFAKVEWPAEPWDPFFNINSPEDLAEAEKLLGR